MSRPYFRSAAITALLAALPGCALPPPAPTPAGQLAPLNHFSKGNDGRLLVDGPQTHKAMLDAMARARDHINIDTYILDAGEIGDKLADLLARKVKQGVKVHLMYDSVGSIKTPKDYFQKLRGAGVAVCEFNPVQELDKVNNRNHRKITVVDGRIAFTGGVNISETYASGSGVARRHQDQEKDKKDGWRDTHVEVQGPVVAQFQRLFLDGWALQDCGPWAEAQYFPKLEPLGSKSMQVVRSDPGSEKSEMYLALLSAVANARSRVWLTFGYFVPDPGAKKALMEAARRGVDVRIVLPGFSDFWAPVYAARSHYGELLESGVRIYEWHEALMHAKTAVIDSAWSSVGSTNLDWRSFLHNDEVNAVVLGTEFGERMRAAFDNDVANSEEIMLEQWQRRSIDLRVKEMFGRLWQYWL